MIFNIINHCDVYQHRRTACRSERISSETVGFSDEFYSEYYIFEIERMSTIHNCGGHRLKTRETTAATREKFK